MTKRLYALCCLGFMSLFIACSAPPEEIVTSVMMNAESVGEGKVELFNIEKQILQTLDAEQDSITLAIEEPVLLNVTLGRSTNYLFISPGDHIQLDTMGSRPVKIGIKGEMSEENKQLKAYDDLIKSQQKEFNMRVVGKFPVDSFMVALDNYFAPIKSLVEGIDNNTAINQDFKEALKSRVQAMQGLDKLGYPGAYEYFTKNKADLPDDYYADIEKLDLSDPSYLVFDEGRRLLKQWNSKEIGYEDFDTPGEYYSALTEKANEKYPNTLARDYINYSNLLDNLSFGDGVDGAEPMIQKYNSEVTNTYLNSKLVERLEPWLPLKKGSAAPDFAAFDREGNEISLSDLKGKRVYVDVWATWCGPCIQEIPALKALETELHDENIAFLSVSIDNPKDKEKWLKFLEKESLQGIQLMADEAWQSDVVTNYNINGIPRFLLIDEAGSIVSSNAPRPSDDKIKELLVP